ncbi:hypothetical protein PAP_01965 [Palaeococcus pacificus DY20341]|uniref:Uncharacterized protein n=1 Tax=Palaeococcus pacificus DY20341 TaxID=1343739 RepID=A0A075LQ48_9EURY|nr:hypothetical protein [Palaeococcus pacificus]AIF68825.1 hypothetical protein PAP_01965 [Palaeococcus pacificus DY20341]
MDFSNIFLGLIADLAVIIFLSAVIGALFYEIATYIGAAKLGKALIFSTLAVVSALVFSSGAFEISESFHMSKRVNYALLASLITGVALLFYFDQYASASVLLGALIAFLNQKQ